MHRVYIINTGIIIFKVHRNISFIVHEKQNNKVHVMLLAVRNLTCMDISFTLL